MSEVIKFANNWIIDRQWEQVRRTGVDILYSPIFSDGKNNDTTWRLTLSTAETISPFSGSHLTMVDLTLLSSDSNVIHAYCKFVLDDFPINEQHFTFTSKNSVRLSFGTNPKNFLSGSALTRLTCEIHVTNSTKSNVPKCICHEGLVSSFNNQKFSDVTICASGKEFQAHKVILAARSPVFVAMFNNDFEESIQSRVDITDIDGEVFGELLRYIYTGKVVDLKNVAMDLVAAADKYGLENLKLLCEEELRTNISIKNAAEFLMLADMYNLKQLKPKAITFINNHAIEVGKTDGWKLMVQLCSNLVTELYFNLAARRIPSGTPI